MDLHTDGYVQFVLETIAEVRQICSDPIINIEQRLDFSCYVPDGFGTGDCVIISDKMLHIIDFKYGRGVLVEAENNPQMMLYALGATPCVRQPVRHRRGRDDRSTSPGVKTSTRGRSRLVNSKPGRRTSSSPKPFWPLKGKGDYRPGPWCTFCRAAIQCRARAEEKLQLAQYEFAVPPLLTDDEIEGILDKLSDLTSWANEIHGVCTGCRAESWQASGKAGRLVEGRSNRKYTDEQAVITAANEAGYHDIYRNPCCPSRKWKSSWAGKPLSLFLGNLVFKPPGKPTLVPLTDKRPEINTAKADFAEE